jgi:hypothetical protein
MRLARLIQTSPFSWVFSLFEALQIYHLPVSSRVLEQQTFAHSRTIPTTVRSERMVKLLSPKLTQQMFSGQLTCGNEAHLW